MLVCCYFNDFFCKTIGGVGVGVGGKQVIIMLKNERVDF